MTEAEWRTSGEPQSMLQVLRGCAVASERKLRLFAHACFELATYQLPDPFIYSSILSVAEQMAEDFAKLDEVRSASEEASRLELASTTRSIARIAASVSCTLEREAFRAALGTIGDLMHSENEEVLAEPAKYSELLRCIFGNPFRGINVGFRPITLNSSWRTSTVLALATGIYQEKAFGRMPILADALQDAGCDNEEVLNHCRQQGVHVRGCWVVDLLTNRK